MALFHVTYTNVNNKSLNGVPMPALQGGPATFMSLSATTSALVQYDGDDFTAPADGFVEILADAAGYVRLAPASDTTAAAVDAGWPVLAGMTKVLSIRKGQQIRCATA